MSIVCPNPQCRNLDRERTILPSDANYCFVCGRPVTEKAIERQKKILNNAKSRRINDANNKISLLDTQLSEVKKLKNKIEIDLINIESEKQSLKLQLEDEIRKNRKNINQENSLTMPNWLYIVFCIIGILFLSSLLMSIKK